MENEICRQQADRLGIQVRVDAAVLGLNSTSQQAGNSGRASMLQA